MLSTTRQPRWASILLLSFLVAFGCEDSTGRLTTHDNHARANDAMATAAGRKASRREASGPGRKNADVWHAVLIQGIKVGYRQTTEATVERNGQIGIETTVHEHIELVREGELSVMDLETICLDRQDGAMVQVIYPMLLGTQATRMQATVDGDILRLRSLSKDQRPEDRWPEDRWPEDRWPEDRRPEDRRLTELPWPGDARGPLCIERSLRDRPMRPDERRIVRMFLPAVGQTVEVTLHAADWDAVPLLTGDKRLLQINVRMRMPGDATMISTLWADARGTIWKETQTVGVEVTTFRTTRDMALASGGNQPLDLFRQALIPVDPRLVSPHGRREIEYEIALPHGDPAKLFCSNARQRIRPLGPNLAKLIVHAGGSENGDKPTAADLASGPLAQSNHPRIRELARSLLPNVDNPRRVAVGLEKLVHGLIEEKSYGKVFASATEVLDSREGDCTEHSVLLVALCRARAIPARAAMGLVYSEPHQAFAYHMWTEAWDGHRWHGLDATRGEDRIGPAHLKMATSSLDGPSALIEMMTVLQNVDGLTIKAVRVEE